MISAHLKGRLGNNLFQYSLVRIIAEINNYEFYIDRKAWNALAGKIFDVDLGLDYSNTNLIYEEQPDECNYKINNNTMLIGFFQCEELYKPYRDKIINWLKLRPVNIESLLEKYNINEYCYIHFRGTDFNNIFYCVKSDYYYEAMNKIKSIYNNIKFVVITDDLNEAYRIFKNVDVLNNDISIDFNLLYNSKFCIIPNSTFSWWSSWLSNKELVVAPKYWDLRSQNNGIWSPKGIKMTIENILYI